MKIFIKPFEYNFVLVISLSFIQQTPAQYRNSWIKDKILNTTEFQMFQFLAFIFSVNQRGQFPP